MCVSGLEYDWFRRFDFGNHAWPMPQIREMVVAKMRVFPLLYLSKRETAGNPVSSRRSSRLLNQ